MTTKEMLEDILITNYVLGQQTRRIKLLEEKVEELKKKYLQLKSGYFNIGLKAFASSNSDEQQQL